MPRIDKLPRISKLENNIVTIFFNNLFRIKFTLLYFFSIIAVNSLFVFLPFLHFAGQIFSPMDILVGGIYVLRDLSQREIKHWVILAMILGCLICYILPEKEIAIASSMAFLIGEVVDWIIFSITKKTLSQRILLSSCISVPLDTTVFLWLAQQFNTIGWIFVSCSKWLGVIIVWWSWKKRDDGKK